MFVLQASNCIFSQPLLVCMAAKPSTVEKLKNTMQSALKNGETETEMAVLIQAFQDSGAISVSGAEAKFGRFLPTAQ